MQVTKKAPTLKVGAAMKRMEKIAFNQLIELI